NERFSRGGQVLDNLSERGRNKSRKDEAHSFFNPDADEAGNTCGVQAVDLPAERRYEKQKPTEIEHHCGPNPRHESAMTVQAEKKVFGSGDMCGWGKKLSE